ncbi:FAD-dependent oxidoreductase [Pseudoalteromonas luteoviolacea]|uniref:FAD-dependent oxidoreductase n=1 Tax=Pseudoalteromonas luteoviolacea TaxID=43657 RepID=UPI00114D9812|nr:FAD-dependent oxidoreductase [Pseudoalteromonas luteoviolacea]TQF67802.1 FAD-binding protein [Pseudoalteromonas luteoviolacea]
MKHAFEYDCLIVGGGIAGAVTAKQLQEKGYKVALIDERAPSRLHLAESLPATIEPLLQRLGLLELIKSPPHFKHTGMVSLWGSSVPQVMPSVAQHHGWKIDKWSIIEQIKSQLPSACVISGKVKAVAIQQNGWRCHIKKNGVKTDFEIHTRFLIDASGRQGYLPRVLNLHRHTFDKLSAFVANVTVHSPLDAQPSVVVEAFQDGWTLTSKISDNQSMVAIFCNQYTPEFSKFKCAKNWPEVANQTQWFKKVVSNGEFEVKILNASSHIVSQLSGKNWLLVGDAAMSFDPLSSHGMTTAIYMAEKAAHAIDGLFNGDNNALGQYSKTMADIYNSYLNELLGYYRLEQRFKDSKFWQSKQHFSDEEVRNIVG